MAVTSARGDVARISAFDVGRIEPDVGKGRIGETPGLHVLDDRVGRLADPRHPARAHAVHPKGRSDPCHLPGGDPARDYLGDRGDDRAVDARVAHEQVIREVGAPPELGDAQVDRAAGGDERTLAVSVALVAAGACILRPGVHDLVDEGFRHDADEFLDVYHPVIESGHLARDARPLL